MDAPYFSFVFLFVAVVSALPISILGIGTRDAMFAILLAGAGVSTAEAVTLSSLFLASMLLTMVVGFAFFLVTPTPLPRGADKVQDEGPQ